MNDRTLAKISLVMAIFGLFGLLVINLFIVPTAVLIGEINDGRLGEIISVDADVKSMSTSNGHIFFTLADGSGEIRAVMWQSVVKTNTDAHNIGAGDAVLVTGQITSYRGDLEIIISKLER